MQYRCNTEIMDLAALFLLVVRAVRKTQGEIIQLSFDISGELQQLVCMGVKVVNILEPPS